MKRRPILFSPTMVKAILDGRKSQTRRIVRPQFETLISTGERDDDHFVIYADIHGDRKDVRWIACPFGDIGTTLYVREKWTMCSHCGAINYQATTGSARTCSACDEGLGKWQPSLFLPKEYSRLFLSVTGIRIESLQDICEGDAIAEGVAAYSDGGAGLYWTFPHLGTRDPITAFAYLWDSINLLRGSWEADPWVWVIDFAVRE